MRWSRTATAYPIGVLMLVASSGCAGPAGSSTAGPAPVAATAAPVVVTAGPIPGTDPAIQRWFLDNGAAKAAFDDALLRAERGVAARTAAECTALGTAVTRLTKVLPKLAGLSAAGQQLAAAIQPAVTTFGSAATACLAGNYPGAQLALDAGVVQQADGQQTVDEILDGDL